MEIGPADFMTLTFWPDLQRQRRTVRLVIGFHLQAGQRRFLRGA